MTLSNGPSLPFKLTPPSAERCLPRPRLFDKLDGGGRAVWVSAPAGAGKTSLLSGWLKAHGQPALWYHIDGGDAEPAAFFAYLGRAAEALGGETLPPLTPEYAFGLTVFARNFFRRLWQTGCRVLVFDDYHDLPADAVLHGLLRHGLEETPADARVIVISRNAPPPEWAKLRLSGNFSLLEWQDLRLDDSECSRFAKQRLQTELDPEAVSALNRRIGGWATGLILALEHGDLERGDRLADNPLLFDFFAAEILDALDTELRDFLLCCALLPEMRADSSAELTGLTDAGHRLAELTRRNLFTVRHRGAGGDSYEFHPLFRQFLLSAATRRYSHEQWQDLSERAAAILCKQGNFETGIALFCDLCAWPAMADALLAVAPQLLAAGRITSLSAWLQALPDGILDQRPWLRYFQGACRLPVNPTDARHYYALAYAGFDATGDAFGAYSAWIAVCASFIFAFENIAAADPWLNALPALRRRYPEFPSTEIEAGVLTFSLFLPTLRHPDTANLEDIALRLEDLAPNIRDAQLKVVAASNLLMYWLGVRGDSLRANRLAVRFAADGFGEATPPVIRLMWETMHAFHYWLSADLAKLQQSLQNSLVFAEDNGVRVLDFYFRLQTVLIPAYTGDRKGVAQALAGLLPFMNSPRSYDAYQYHLLRLLEAKANRDRAAIRDAAGEVERYAARTEILSCALYALLAAVWRSQSEQDIGAALSGLQRAQTAAPGCGSVIAQWDVLYAALELASYRPEPDAERQAMAAFFDFGNRYGLLNCYGIHWHRPALAKYCVAALELGIAPDYTRRLIRLHKLIPEQPPMHLENWPWPVRIRTLGRFEIDVDGAPLIFSASRVPVKPLELLKALIGLGCRDVDQDLLADALWPDADGDSARRALHTNLHRLRSLLGEGSLIFRDGRLSLDNRHCWCDAAVVDTLASADGACACADTGTCPLPPEGEFLARETGLPWLITARQRIARIRADAEKRCRKAAGNN